jgi:uncharacterized damage-inducible protein DinB
MSELSLSGKEMLAWNEKTSDGWRQLISENPEVLAMSCDIMGVKTVGELLQHIVAVELRYAQRLAGEPESDYNDIPFHSAEAIFATHDRTLSLLQPLLADAAFNWSTEIEFQTITAGRIRASRRTILIHLLMHSIRHYAQLATLVRTHGFNPDWPMDFLFVAAHPA